MRGKQLILLGSLLVGAPGRALDIGSDLFVAGVFGMATEVSFHSSTHIYLPLSSVAVGPVAVYDRLHAYAHDVAVGGGARLGERIFVEFQGGILQRTFEGAIGNGYFASAALGIYINPYWRLTIPLTAKRIESGLSKQWHIEAFPRIGLEVHL